MHRADTHDESPDTGWRITEIGQAQVRSEAGAWLLTANPTPADQYSDAQISDYVTDDFRWTPPLRMTVTASLTPAAPALRGTAGFGFWNQPFMPGQVRLRLPQAIWFFFSAAPSNINLAQGVPGPGWKAATINARRWQFLALAPAAPLGVLLMRVPALYQRLWPVGQRAIGVSEHLLDHDLLTETHTYTLDWRADGAAFAVDGKTVHQAPVTPGGPLGFVAWVDNQYAIVTPQGQFGFGTVPLPQAQTLRLDDIWIEPQ